MTTNTITRAGTLSTSAYVLSGTGVTAINAGTLNVSSTDAVTIKGTTNVLSNTGSILSSAVSGGAVEVYSGSSGAIIINHLSAVIEGVVKSTNEIDGVFAEATATVVNYGFIIGNSAVSTNGIVFNAGTGFVTNFSTGTVSGGGIWMGTSGTVVNQGQIIGDSIYGGVYLEDAGQVTNLSGGIISANGGGYGVKINSGAGTITNAGTINSGSTNGPAVILATGAANRVIVDTTGVFIGTVNGGTAADATLELATGTSTGTISLAGFTNFGSLTFDTGADWLVSGASTGLLASATIAGFGTGDTLAITGTETISHTASSGGLTKVTLAGSSNMTLTFTGPISGFHTSTSGGVTDLTTVCFCIGTMIRTPNGEVAIEDLKFGDRVVTLGNDNTRIITWIGKGKVLATSGQRSAATPVIVRKHALADNVPNQDLHVTKAHSLFIDGVLIPVEFLVNHRSIVWDDRAQEVEIYHVELDQHHILIANGAPAESYRDDGNRWLFQNANSGWDLPPQEPYAPVLTGGPVVDEVWHRLLDRAGPTELPSLTDDADLHLIVDGMRVDAREQTDGTHMFRLRSQPKSVIIGSRAAAPAELGFARDPRCLGAALRRVTIRQGAKFMLIDADDERLTDGFHDYEPAENIRWTNGYAALPIEAFARFDQGAEVAVHLGGSTRYPDYRDEAETQATHAGISPSRLGTADDRNISSAA
ncbi:Hint domain-containing protein [Acidisphaera sp. S103]|uniref:Hint domain-containing protein n=1 Tax=Acidisphaera sp. S103 TaxID=1747223 RepID=UPI00131ABA27|nr:Hint domain-containing protein [Acidisphaera sp. S103]